MENSSSQPILSPLQQQAQLRRKIFSVGIGMLLIGALGVGLFVFLQEKTSDESIPSLPQESATSDDFKYEEKDLSTLTGTDRFPADFPQDVPIDPTHIVQSFTLNQGEVQQSSVVLKFETLSDSYESLFEEYFKQNGFTFTPSESDEFPRSFKADKEDEQFHVSLFEEEEQYVVFVTRILK